MRKNCLLCGKPITNRHSNNVKYCSEKCARQAELKPKLKAISKRALGLNNKAQAVYRAYDYKCALCDWQATPDLIKVGNKIQYAHGNEIHHIIAVAEGGTEEDGNLILLCPNCHKKVHMGLIDATTLQAHTKSFTLTEKERLQMRVKSAENIASLIFNDE